MDKSVNVLIVDDYRTMRNIMRTLLYRIGFENVEEAESGGEALEKLRAGEFGLVISDWNMTPMTGLQLLEIIRNDSKLWRLPFIMVTAEQDTKDVAAAAISGTCRHIVKPFTSEQIEGKIALALIDQM